MFCPMMNQSKVLGQDIQSAEVASWIWAEPLKNDFLGERIVIGFTKVLTPTRRPWIWSLGAREMVDVRTLQWPGKVPACCGTVVMMFLGLWLAIKTVPFADLPIPLRQTPVPRLETWESFGWTLVPSVFAEAPTWGLDLHAYCELRVRMRNWGN